MSRKIWKTKSIIDTLSAIQRIPSAVVFAGIGSALLISTPWLATRAMDSPRASASGIPFEIESRFASQPLESVLPCNADEPPRAYTVTEPTNNGVRTAILCDGGKYSIYTSAPPPRGE